MGRKKDLKDTSQIYVVQDIQASKEDYSTINWSFLVLLFFNFLLDICCKSIFDVDIFGYHLPPKLLP